MIKKIPFTLLVTAVAFTLLSGCHKEESTAGRLSVLVSILPQEYFVERIGAGLVDVQTLIRPGQNPHTYSTTPAQMAKLSQARLYFRIGAEFENGLMPKLESSYKNLLIVDTRKGIALRETESDGHHHETEDHGAKDPHIWMDPELVKIQAATIRDALIAADTANSEIYRMNYGSFALDLDSLDARLHRVLSPLKGKKLFVYHPSFGYFTDAYGLKQVAFESEGKEPGARRLARLIEEAKTNGVKAIFIQPQISQKSADAVAEQAGCVVVPIDPLEKDYISNLENIALKIEAGLKGKQ